MKNICMKLESCKQMLVKSNGTGAQKQILLAFSLDPNRGHKRSNGFEDRGHERSSLLCLLQKALINKVRLHAPVQWYLVSNIFCN